MTIKVRLPLLPGSLSTARSTCGKAHCVCKAHPPKLHGIYYRWTGILQGKRTTVTLSVQEAKECERRIKNYKAVRKVLDKMLNHGLDHAPWKTMRS